MFHTEIEFKVLIPQKEKVNNSLKYDTLIIPGKCIKEILTTPLNDMGHTSLVPVTAYVVKIDIEKLQEQYINYSFEKLYIVYPNQLTDIDIGQPAQLITVPEVKKK